MSALFDAATADRIGDVCDWVGLGTLLFGAVLCLASAIGLVRLDELYARMHAATKPQVLGVLLVLLGVGLRLRDPSVIGLLVLVGLFQLLTIPASAQMLARAHLRTRPPGYDDAPRRVADITDATDRQY